MTCVTSTEGLCPPSLPSFHHTFGSSTDPLMRSSTTKHPPLPRLVVGNDDTTSSSVRHDVTPSPRTTVSEPSPSWSPGTTSSPSPRQHSDGKRKRPRFLGDIDRRMIVQRLANGEKQADLAREFGVTRAAICHLNKNRDEILTRFDILAKSPQGRQMIANYVRTPSGSSSLHELRTPSAAVLLTRLHDATQSSPAALASAADRLMAILMEEALVLLGTQTVRVQDAVGSQHEGKAYARPVFALSIGEAGRPLLNTFATMEPTAFRGFVHVSGTTSEELVLRRLDLPENAKNSNVLLFRVGVEDAEQVEFIVDSLETRGIPVSQICIVCVTAAADAVTTFSGRFRDVKIVTAVIHDAGHAPSLAGFGETRSASSS